MRLLRILKSYWYAFVIGLLAIIFVFMPTPNESTLNVVHNEAHRDSEKICVYVKGEVSIKGKMYFYKGAKIRDLMLSSGMTDYTVPSTKLDEELIDAFTYTFDMKEGKCVNVSNNSTKLVTLVNTSKVKGNKSDLININTASESELMSLDDIGKDRANNIIKYRKENGGFKDIEEIKKVDSIGESTYAKIKDFITCE